MSESLIKVLLEQVDGIGPVESVLESIEEQRAYEKQMDEAIKERFEQDRKSRANSWAKAQEHYLD